MLLICIYIYKPWRHLTTQTIEYISFFNLEISFRCCDHCEEWYHGDCIRVTEEKAQFIKRYYCKKCQSKKPNLQIVFKSKYKEYLAEKKKEKERGKPSDRDRHKEREKDKHGDKDRSKERDRHGQKEKRKETEEERAKRKEREREKERRESSKHKSEVRDKHRDLIREKLEKPRPKEFSKTEAKLFKEERVKLETKSFSNLDQKPKAPVVKRELSGLYFNLLCHLLLKQKEYEIYFVLFLADSSDDSYRPGKSIPRKKAHLEESNDDKASDHDEDWKPFAFETNSQKKGPKEKITKNHKTPVVNKVRKHFTDIQKLFN